MVYLVTFNWGWLAGAAAIGFGMGWISPVSRARVLSTAAWRWTLAVLVGLAIISATHLLPGEIGYWLDLGLVMIVAYLAGCAVGALLRYGLLMRPSAF
jgi:hypothetical protein